MKRESQLSWVFKSPVFIVFIVASCIADVRFEEPQPEGISNEKEIPGKLRGKYASEADSSLLTISRNYIIRTNEHHKIYSREEFDSLTEKLPTKDTVIIDGLVQYNVKLLGSKYSVRLFLSDTLLNLCSSQVLRKFKGYYFVSLKERDGSWIVKRITYNQKGLLIGSIKSKEEMLNLRQITAASDDSTIVFHPSRKEFKRFMTKNSFMNEEKFLKLK